jgi:hypothetical protein
VEAADNFAATCGMVPVRDSKSLDGPVLNFSTAAFSSFVARVKAGNVGSG